VSSGSYFWKLLINMALSGPQITSKLHKKHLIQVGNNILDLQPRLSTDTHRAALIATITNHLETEQDCRHPKCMGPCKPDLHDWSQEEYTPDNEADNPGVQAALNNLLKEVQCDLPPGEHSTSFLNPGIPGTSHDGTVDLQQQKLLLIRKTCAVMNLDPLEFAALYKETKQKSPPEPVLPTGSLPPTSGTETVADVADVVIVNESVPAMPDVLTASDALMVMLCKQQQDQKTMMEKQAEHQDQLLKLLEANQQNSIPTATTTTTITAGRVGVQAARNSHNLALAGISLPPMLRIEGDLSTIDMSKMKSKLKSGRHWTGEAVATVMEPWPQQYLDRIVQAPVTHNKLTLPQYFCGSITKIFSELDPTMRGSRVENQVKFLMYMSKQSLLSPWDDILALSDSFYSALEQSTVSWENWTAIERWWVQSLDSLRAKNMLNPNKKFKTDKKPRDGGEDDSSSSNKAVGINISFYNKNNICIKFNTGKCDKPASHRTTHGNNTLKHICAGCLKIDKGEDDTHPAKDCEFKTQFFV
jgi:hypothetical protein